jgi:hypothetical protein
MILGETHRGRRRSGSVLPFDCSSTGLEIFAESSLRFSGRPAEKGADISSFC